MILLSHIKPDKSTLSCPRYVIPPVAPRRLELGVGQIQKGRSSYQSLCITDSLSSLEMFHEELAGLAKSSGILGPTVFSLFKTPPTLFYKRDEIKGKKEKATPFFQDNHLQYHFPTTKKQRNLKQM